MISQPPLPPMLVRCIGIPHGYSRSWDKSPWEWERAIYFPSSACVIFQRRSGSDGAWVVDGMCETRATSVLYFHRPATVEEIRSCCETTDADEGGPGSPEPSTDCDEALGEIRKAMAMLQLTDERTLAKRQEAMVKLYNAISVLERAPPVIP